MKSFDYLKYRVFCRVLKVTESDYVNDMAEYFNDGIGADWYDIGGTRS